MDLDLLDPDLDLHENGHIQSAAIPAACNCGLFRYDRYEFVD